jgi:hypothetical protein
MKNPAAYAVRVVWEHSEAGKASNKKSRQSDTGKARQKRANESEAGKARKVRYVRSDKGRERGRIDKRNQRLRKPGQKIQDSISASLTKLLSGQKLTSTTLQLTGFASCTDLVNYLVDNAYDKRMTATNYGVGGWDLDHGIPKNEYDHTDADDVRRCWHHLNLRAEWYKKNRSKGAKIIPSIVKTVPEAYWPKKWGGIYPV